MERSIEPIRPLSPRSRWEAPRAPEGEEERRRRERERRTRAREAARRAEPDARLDDDADAGGGQHIDVQA